MSDLIKSAKDIFLLKRKKKDLDDEISDFEFGFDSVPEYKKIYVVKQSVNKHIRANRMKKNIAFIETNNEQTNQITSNKNETITKSININDLKQAELKEIQNASDIKLNEASNVVENVIQDEKSNADANVIQSVLSELIQIPGKNYIEIPHSDVGKDYTYTENSIEFGLNFNDDDDDLFITQISELGETDVELESFSKSKEPLLFRNHFFKIIDTNNNSRRAMCVACGLDENNSPKTVISAPANVSSNFVTHLKVIFDKLYFDIGLFS